MDQKNISVLIYSENQVKPELGGTERATSILANYLLKNGFNVSYLIRKNTLGINDDSNYLPNAEEIFDQRNIQYLDKLIEEKSIDYLFVTIQTLKIYDIISQLKNKPIVIAIIHASIFEYLPNFFKMFKWELNSPRGFVLSAFRLVKLPILYHNFKRSLKNKFNKIFLHANKVIVLSKRYKEDLSQLNLNYNKDKIYIIENSNPFEVEIKEVCKQNKVLFVGRVTHLKRIDHLLKAWKEVQKCKNPWQLMIVGNGDEEENLKKMVTQNDINNVSFMGNQDPKVFYKSSQIICLTSIYEGMPMVLIEALQFGVVPVIYSTFGAAEDIIQNGYNGILIKPFDYKAMAESINFLINNPKELERMRQNALASSKRYNIEIIGPKWLETLQSP